MEWDNFPVEIQVDLWRNEEQFFCYIILIFQNVLTIRLPVPNFFYHLSLLKHEIESNTVNFPFKLIYKNEFYFVGLKINSNFDQTVEN